MKRVVLREDLMKKSNYSKQYGINRVTLNKMINEGKLIVERIDGTDYIRLTSDKK